MAALSAAIFSFPARAAENSTNFCARHAGETCETSLTYITADVNDLEAGGVEFGTAENLEEGDTITIMPNIEASSCVFNYPSPGSGKVYYTILETAWNGFIGVYKEDSTENSDGKWYETALTDATPYPCGLQSTAVNIGPLSAQEASDWNANHAIGIFWSQDYQGYWADDVSVADIKFTITKEEEETTCPTSDPAYCTNIFMNPSLSWSNPATTTNWTTSSTFKDYIDSIFQSATGTVPGCYLTKTAETLDTLFQITKNEETQTLNYSPTTGTTLTFDLNAWDNWLPSWVYDELRPIMWNIFAVLGWSAFGWYVWNDLFGSGEDDDPT